MFLYGASSRMAMRLQSWLISSHYAHFFLPKVWTLPPGNTFFLKEIAIGIIDIAGLPVDPGQIL